MRLDGWAGKALLMVEEVDKSLTMDEGRRTKSGEMDEMNRFYLFSVVKEVRLERRSNEYVTACLLVLQLAYINGIKVKHKYYRQTIEHRLVCILKIVSGSKAHSEHHKTPDLTITKTVGHVRRRRRRRIVYASPTHLNKTSRFYAFLLLSKSITPAHELKNIQPVY